MMGDIWRYRETVRNHFAPGSSPSSPLSPYPLSLTRTTLRCSFRRASSVVVLSKIPLCYYAFLSDMHVYMQKAAFENPFLLIYSGVCAPR